MFNGDSGLNITTYFPEGGYYTLKMLLKDD